MTRPIGGDLSMVVSSKYLGCVFPRAKQIWAGSVDAVKGTIARRIPFR